MLRDSGLDLAGVPSIVYGMLGLALFVRVMEPITSGSLFGVVDSNGRTIFSAGLTMGILVLPIVIINAQEAIKAVPSSLRDASYGLGATRWQTIWRVTLPAARSGVITAVMLGIGRATAVAEHQDLPAAPQRLAATLANAVAGCGVFYEAHLAEWVRGRRSIASIRRARTGAPGAA